MVQMKRLVTGVALTAVLAGCTSVEQGSASRQETPYPNAACAAVPEAFANSSDDELFSRVGSAVLDCAKTNHGRLLDDTVGNGVVTVTFPVKNGNMILSAYSRSSALGDSDTFARNTTQVAVTSNPNKSFIPSVSYGTIKQMGDGERWMYSNGNLAGVLENNKYIDTSTEPDVIACTEEMIRKTAIAASAIGPRGGALVMPEVPLELPKDCDAV